MAKMEKSRKVLILFGCLLALLAIVCIVGGFVLFFSKFHWFKLICGIFIVRLGILFALFSVYFILAGVSKAVDGYQSKTQSKLVNKSGFVRRCTKCGKVLEEGEDACSKCGQTASSCKVCECGAENNIENKRCTSCGRKL